MLRHDKVGGSSVTHQSGAHGGSPKQPPAANSQQGQPKLRERLSVADWNYTVKMSDDEHEQTIAEDLVVTKYKMSGDIANRE